MSIFDLFRIALGISALLFLGWKTTYLFWPQIVDYFTRFTLSLFSILLFIPALFVILNVYFKLPITAPSIVKIIFLLLIIVLFSQQVLYKFIPKEDSKSHEN